MTLTQAVQNSINSVFCNIGKELGADVVLEYAKRFGSTSARSSSLRKRC